MLGKVLVLVIFSFVICLSDAARILAVFPVPSISHQVVFRPLTQELAKRGHEVVVITADPAFTKGQAPANLTEIDIHDMSYMLWRQSMLKTVKGDKDAFETQVGIFFDMIKKVIEMHFTTDEAKEIIFDKKQNFDLLILEACVSPILAFKHILNVPVIQMSSFGAFLGNFESVGAPTFPLLYPSFVRQRLYNLTMWEKITEMYNHYKIEYIIANEEKKSEATIKRVFGPDVPPISELKKEIDALFLNTHPIWDDNHPVPPNVVYTWGLHKKPQKELPKDLKTFMDSSKHGVIYMSFGTNMSPSFLPPEKIQMFIRVFSQLPYDILWKWDKDEMPGRSKNIRIGKWFPQSDLLKHPNLKLFITQGGLQSTDEAIVAGVPLVGIPMLGDQWFNVEKYVHHKIGVKLEISTLTEEEFRNSIDTVIENESYRKNIIKLRELMHDQPESALDRAVWWTEHILRHGGARHFRGPAANMSWSEYLELELVATVLLALLFAIVSIVVIIYFLFKYTLRTFLRNFKLKHPNLKLFITQGGLQSTDEAIVAGVPLVGIPMLGDQWFNVEKYVHHKIGVKLEISTLTEEEFRNSIDTVIENESYRKNIIKLRELMHDQPESALDRAVWWTEHILRHGGARHFRGPAANMSWSEYLELELVATVLLALLFAIVSIVVIIYFLFKYTLRTFLRNFKLKVS